MSLRGFLISSIAVFGLVDVVSSADSFTVVPADVTLKGNFAQTQLLVIAEAGKTRLPRRTI